MEKYTVISLYYLHIVPAYQLFHLNQYFLILGNKCSIKNLLGYLTVILCFVFNNSHLSTGLVTLPIYCLILVRKFSSSDEVQLAHSLQFCFILTTVSVVESTVKCTC